MRSLSSVPLLTVILLLLLRLPWNLGGRIKVSGCCFIKKLKMIFFTAVVLKQGQFYPSGDNGQHLEIFLIITAVGRCYQLSVDRPGMLLNILHCTGQAPTPHQRIFWPQMSILPLLGNPALQGVFITPLIKMRTLGLRGAKQLAQDLTTSKWWHHNSDTQSHVLISFGSFS